MNTQKCMLYLTVILSFAISGLPAMAQALTFAELRPDAPICRTSKAKRPKLPVNFEHDAPVEITADLNGDGWCDYALGVGYPVNSQMNSYYLSQMLLLGGAKKWEYALHGRKPWLSPVADLDNDIWPLFRVDLTDIQLVYPRQVGAPYVLGLVASGHRDPKLQNSIHHHCYEYHSVHQWDEKVGAFKKVDEATRAIVIKYYYSAVIADEERCKARK